MLVETYEIEEINASEASVMAADSAAMELVEKLGLKGQLKLSSPETGTRFPYPRMSAVQKAVFETLFPTKTGLTNYDQGIIPLRVLQVAAHCKDMPQTAHLQVWHAESIKEDPILVGSPTPYSSEEYLLARWGDALPSFDEMKEKAALKFETLLRLDIAKGKDQFERLSSRVKELARAYVETGSKPTWWIHE